ncbi:MAG: ATP-binding protein [Chiayiivirga sp.]|jgi:ligand-binding sensor domain-containing protein/signal transduction histidine kinase|uniref:two-component regulator propeller domain-containing protein n=1 Tax=Chiayiivirga sp. TaxID=2041042 RepID=UPI0025BCF8FF|nr:two-component regulator propeller domain-containing protein [Chiayiivirga sp.]MCI1710000.1 ATP-binding protein [Chiayiivirga sp.]MCI1730424.1 ATP-binding protein [Chiayiivirga sp.]
MILRACLSALLPSLLAILLAVTTQRAMAADEPPGLAGLRLQHLGIEQGLSQVSARAIAQDSEGMIWIGTQDGLNRYDGEEFRVFRRDAADPYSLIDNHVTTLYLDRSNRLWVGTQSGGLGWYDANAGRFRNYPVGLGRSDAVADVHVQAIGQAQDGRVWVASGRGHLQRLDQAALRFEDLPLPGEVQVRSLLALPGGDMLVGSTHGLWRWHEAEGQLRPWAPALSVLDPDVQALARTSEGRLWVGTATLGVFELSSSGEVLRRLDANQGLAGADVRSLLVDDRGQIWVGTFTGLSRIDARNASPRSWARQRSQDEGLASERVHALLQDRDGLIWIGTWHGGAHLHLPGSEAFQEFRAVAGDPRTLPANAVRDVHADGDGSLWLGMPEGGGLVQFDLARGVLQHFRPVAGEGDSLASDRVQAVARDLDGRLWVGMVDAGLDRQRADGVGFEHFRADPDDPQRPQGDNVLALHVDRSGALWIGYQDLGMDMLCRGCDEFRRFPVGGAPSDGLPGPSIGSVFESSRGELWVGARPGALARLDRATGRFTSLADLLVDTPEIAPRSVTTISETRGGELWVGTQGNGIVRLLPQPDGRYRGVAYTHKDGLAAEAIGSLIEDARGAMWVSTTLGISRIDPGSGRIENFSARAGAQVDGYFVDAGARLRDGRIVFGGLRGLTAFDPIQVGSRVVLHKPVITDVRGFQTALDGQTDWRYRRRESSADQLWLRAGSGGFGFSFSALAFADPELVQYSYRLDPIDRDWTTASAAQRNAGYPHLAPGNYRLRLRARFPGEDYSSEREVEVRLDPLWWQSLWARAALVLALVGPLAMWGWSRYQQGVERARAQGVLAESEERLKLSLWGTGDEFWDADMHSGRLVRVNPLRHLRVTEEVPDLSFRELVPRVHDEDRDHFTRSLRAHVNGDSEEFDCVYRLQDLDQQWRWVRSRGRTVARDAGGRALRMAGITEDITELREYERTLERVNLELEERVGQRTSDLMLLNRELVSAIDKLKLTQHQLVESEKLAALGGLVAGIAHEVNTPLGIGVTAASHLEQQAQAFARQFEQGQVDPQQLDAFRRTVLDASAMVLRNLQRADRMIRSFKQVAVDQASEQPRRIDLRAYLEEILVSLQPTLKRSRHALALDVPEGLVLLTHPGALYQMVANLVMNSVTHAFTGRDSGNIRIAARLDGESWLLEYSDDGVGMSEDVRRHVFEPFFTTRRGQGGSGLGLHILYNLVVQVLGGSIDLQTAPGQGARFVFRIPLREAPVPG